MAIPGILLAIALFSLSGAALATIVIAIMIPEIPRIVRLVHSVVLAVREEPCVEAAVAAGIKLPLILFRHICPTQSPHSRFWLSILLAMVCAIRSIRASRGR